MGKHVLVQPLLLKKKRHFLSSLVSALLSQVFADDRRPCIAQGRHSEPQGSLSRSVSGEDQRGGLNVCWLPDSRKLAVRAHLAPQIMSLLSFASFY